MARTPELSLDPWELCDGLPGCVCVVGPEGDVAYGNREWRATFAAREAPLSCAEVARAIHPADLPDARDAWGAAARARTPYERTLRIRDRSATFRWYHVRARPIAGEEMERRYVAIVTDVDEAQRYAQYMRLLGEASDVFAREPDVEAALAQIARSVVPLVADWFVLHRPSDEGGFVAKLVVNEDPARARQLLATIDRGGSTSERLVRQALSRGEPALLEDISPDVQRSLARDPEHLRMIRDLNARSILVVPIVGREETWGALQFRNDWTAPRALTDAEVRLGRELAKHTAAALDNAALVAKAERAANELRFLAHVGETMVESLDLMSRLNRLVEAVVPRLADWATVNLLLEDGAVETVAIAHRDPAKREVTERLRGPYYGNLETDQGTPVALRTGRPRMMSGVDERYLRTHLRPETYEDVMELGSDSAFVVPLSAHGEMYGTLAAMRTERERPFVESEMWLIEELARRAAVAIANARLFERNANVANAFQAASLPASLPSAPGARFWAFYAPGRSDAMVGGDWYDAFATEDGRFVVSIGDVSGSGLSAAVVMGSVRQLIRGAVQLQPDARIILDATDRALRAEYPDSIVTAFVAILDLQRRTIAYASAGHPPPFLCGPNTLVALDQVGLPLGLRGPDEPPEQVVPYAAGDLLALYTDGLSEATHDVLEGERSIRGALRRKAVRAADNPARALHDAVIPAGAPDDVAILVVRLGEPT